MTGRGITATHGRKARREGRCPLCRGPIHIGQPIVKVGRGGSWLHRQCFTDRYRAASREEP